MGVEVPNCLCVEEVDFEVKFFKPLPVFIIR